jgi:hypothetical protein
LAYRTANTKHEKVQMDFLMLRDEGPGGRQLVRVDQRDGTQDGGKGTGCEHEFDEAEIEVALEQSRLELARERIKKQIEAQEHEPCPLGRVCFGVAQIVHAKAQIVGGGHEQGYTASNHYSDKIIVCRIFNFRVIYDREMENKRSENEATASLDFFSVHFKQHNFADL